MALIFANAIGVENGIHAFETNAQRAIRNSLPSTRRRDREARLSMRKATKSAEERPGPVCEGFVVFDGIEGGGEGADEREVQHVFDGAEQGEGRRGGPSGGSHRQERIEGHDSDQAAKERSKPGVFPVRHRLINDGADDKIQADAINRPAVEG